MDKQVINIGDKVAVSEKTYGKTYRPDLVIVTVEDIKRTEKMVQYHLSDGSYVIGTTKICKINQPVSE